MATSPAGASCAVGGMLVPGGTDLTLVLTALRRMEHRGSAVTDQTGHSSGDGTGILLALPEVIHLWLAALRSDLPPLPAPRLAVGVFFLPVAQEAASLVQERTERLLATAGIETLAWRTVPTEPLAAGLGVQARSMMPMIRQIFLAAPASMTGETFASELHRLRQAIEAANQDLPLHIASLSCRLINYKGMLTAPQFPVFYPDLTARGREAMISDMVVFHRRFSTNTYPDWFLAQPFRLLAHNGEINAIAANRAAVHNIPAPDQGSLLMPGGSDSADLDRVVEHFLCRNQDLALTLSSLIPPAWLTDVARLPTEVIRFYRYFKYRLMGLGQWEGPAGILACDGRVLVAKADRIGLRPLRWLRLHNHRVLIASEVGAFDVAAEEIAMAGKLGCGQVLQVDRQGRMLFDEELLTASLPNHPRLQERMARLRITRLALPRQPLPCPDEKRLRQEHRLHAFSPRHEQMLAILMETGTESVVAMGKAVPAAGLSPAPSSIHDFFLQQFAQITNPPIDFLREKKFFDLATFLGDRAGDQGWEVASPILEPATMTWLAGLPASKTLAATMPDRPPLAPTCRARLATLLDQVIQGIDEGYHLFILQDDNLTDQEIPIPGPILVSHLRQGLILAAKRHRCSLVLKLGEMREPHDLAVNLAFGANAVCPTRIWQVAALLGRTWQDEPRWRQNLSQGLDKALLKILSKMGVTTTVGYQSSRLFMPFGLGEDIRRMLGCDDELALGGVGLEEVLGFRRQRLAHGPRQAALAWQESRPWIAQAGLTGDPACLAALETARSRPFKPLHLLAIHPPVPVPVNRLRESPAEIIARYLVGAAMSHGALKEEAHRAVAAAFNDLAGRSNCGEGGEAADRDQGRFHSRIRQVASGRFGVSARYLVHADELQIKIAQGAKPGEGGQLMGVKVDEVIARNRHCAPGTTLISPQTHQDIYSIEDLKQLVHDLKAVNPRALVSVKIAAETGIGIIAVGLAKMAADVIEIDGLDGGTAATPESSREHAAHYAELGLAAAHAALSRQGLRGLVKLRATSGIKSGAEVVKYFLLGADEVAIGTALLVAQGCIACSQCHTGSCPAAIAGTPPKSDPRLPDLEERIRRVRGYLLALARDTARLAGLLGVERLAELTGRVDLLRPLTVQEQAVMVHLCLDPWLTPAPQPVHEVIRPPRTSQTANQALLTRALPALQQGRGCRLTIDIGNEDLSLGAALAGEMARRWPAGYPKGQRILVRARGHGGQKLGFAGVTGLEIHLAGMANDTPGAAMSGGVLVIAPPPEESETWVTAGNAVGYGATGGEIDVKGRVGERCAIRNSGASIVVTGAGDFLAEYQTGGQTICLSRPGMEIGAGMTGGEIFLYLPPGSDLAGHLAQEVIVVQTSPDQWRPLVQRLRRYARRTGSPMARRLLADWTNSQKTFYRVVPAGRT